MKNTFREKVEKVFNHPSIHSNWDDVEKERIDAIVALLEEDLTLVEDEQIYKWGYQNGKKRERQRTDKMALEILEDYFPKMNQDDLTKPSPNGRGAAMAYMAILRTNLSIDV